MSSLNPRRELGGSSFRTGQMLKFVYLVDPPQRRHVNSLSSDGSGATNPGGVLAGAGVNDGVDKDLEGVLPSQQVDDLEAVLDNSHGQKLLSVVSAVHHQAGQDEGEMRSESH